MGSLAQSRRGNRCAQVAQTTLSTRKPQIPHHKARTLPHSGRCQAVKQETASAQQAPVSSTAQEASTRPSPPQPPYKVVITGGTKASVQRKFPLSPV